MCVNTTCPSLITVVVPNIRRCQMACLKQVQCKAGSFHQVTPNCKLLGDILNQNMSMLPDSSVISMVIISESRFSPAK
ncbi:hypothetical protein I4U23_011492 [Adineta vaga]|nr:hypothetical protein I4U23_011492 [Adineta vaga]